MKLRRKVAARHCEIASNRLLELADRLSGRSRRPKTNASALHITHRLLRDAELEIGDVWQLYADGGGEE